MKSGSWKLWPGIQVWTTEILDLQHIAATFAINAIARSLLPQKVPIFSIFVTGRQKLRVADNWHEHIVSSPAFHMYLCAWWFSSLWRTFKVLWVTGGSPKQVSVSCFFVPQHICIFSSPSSAEYNRISILFLPILSTQLISIQSSALIS